jgi:hypothetical protein
MEGFRNEHLEGLRAALAEAAQRVYDAWEQDAEGQDPELGAGGICHLIADAFCAVMSTAEIQAASVSASCGDQHVWAIAKTSEGVFEIDIPPSVYESGSGYVWRKRPGVRFEPSDIVIGLVSANPAAFDEMAEAG